MLRCLGQALLFTVVVFHVTESCRAVTWQHQYEADVLPEEFSPAFSLQHVGSPFDPESSTTLNEGGWVEIDAHACCWYQWDMNTNWNVGPNGSTIEFRMALDEVQPGIRYGTSFQVTDSVGGMWYFTWDAENVYFFGDSQGQAAFDTSEFNTYRFTFLQDGSANLYLNDDPTPRFTALGDLRFSLTNFSIGQLANEARGKASFDYVYWTTQGAFPPESPFTPGDYNENGVVDAADYTVWRDLLGGSVLPNETASPGIVDGDDYLVWKENFGAGMGASASTSVVPEPHSLMLAIAACIPFVQALRRKRRAS